MNDEDYRWPIAITILLILAAVVWYYRDQEAAPSQAVPEAASPEPVAEERPADAEPRHIVPVFEADPSVERELTPLPPLDDSDSYFLLEIAAAFGPAIESLLVREDVIDRLVATVDALPRKQLPASIRPVGLLGMSFHPEFGNAAITLGPGSYSRFDRITAMIAATDMDDAYDTYRRFYPLFQSAYEQLGYPNGYFNDRLVEVIDHLVSGPTPEGPLVLHRPKVLYEFTDPELQALSSGRKLLLRMGPDNAAAIRTFLTQFRAQLTAAN